MSNYEDFFAEIPQFLVVKSNTSYSENSLGIKRFTPWAIQLKQQSEIDLLFKLAIKHKVRLHPISTGKNWGYGSALSPDDEAIVVDLSDLKKIEFDHVIGAVTIEPGVTQLDLYNYLKKNNLPYIVPTTGAGPNVSILGNALERGFGITPFEDHFAAVLGMKVYCPDGIIYTPAMQELSGRNIWKWDIGPYIQGLFTHSSLGIISEIKIKLASVPDTIGIFKAESTDLSELVEVAKKLREIELIHGINIMNGLRTNAMNKAKKNENIWTLLGSYYCKNELNGGTRKLIKREFRSRNIKVQIITNRLFEFLRPILRKILGKEYVLLEGFFDVLKGKPTELALEIVGGESNANKTGLIWYSPIIPIDSSLIKKTSEMISRICSKNGFPPLITFTLVNSFCIDATIPLIFDKDKETNKAWLCYDELLNVGIKELGIIPYRLPINRFHILKDSAANHLHKIIKSALDPNGILARGRYETDP